MVVQIEVVALDIHTLLPQYIQIHLDLRPMVAQAFPQAFYHRGPLFPAHAVAVPRDH
jgi:hypothetical protein